MKVIFAAGGTGGHINPALASAGELRRRHPDADILFIGSTLAKSSFVPISSIVRYRKFVRSIFTTRSSVRSFHAS